MLAYHRADERPAWEITVTINGAAEDLSSGHDFQVKLAAAATPATAVLTKTAGIVGATGGVVTVGWAPNELDLPPGRYNVQLKTTRTSDSFEWTITDRMQIKARI